MSGIIVYEKKASPKEAFYKPMLPLIKHCTINQIKEGFIELTIGEIPNF